jgi:integrase
MTDSPSKIPKGVYQKNGRWYRVVRNRWIALTRVDEGLLALRRALRETPTDRPPVTVGELLAAYLPQAEISATTRREYERIADTRLAHHFGALPIGALRPSHVAMYLEKRKRDGHSHMGNRERAVLSAAYECALRHGWADFNPCRGVRRNTERPRRRYVSDAEFLEAFEAAPEPLQDVMALALLTGLRQGDLRALRRSALTEDGIYVAEGKTGKRRLIGWSDALSHFVRRAVERSQCDHVLTHKFGQPWTLGGIQTAFKRLRVDWHFHDIRAKAASDASHNILGHGSGMLGVYVRHQKVKALR